MLNTSYLSIENIYEIICEQLKDIDKQGNAKEKEVFLCYVLVKIKSFTMKAKT